MEVERKIREYAEIYIQKEGLDVQKRELLKLEPILKKELPLTLTFINAKEKWLIKVDNLSNQIVGLDKRCIKLEKTINYFFGNDVKELKFDTEMYHIKMKLPLYEFDGRRAYDIEYKRLDN